MDLNTLRMWIYEMNPDELFYRELYQMRMEGKPIEPFIQQYDIKKIQHHHLLIPEVIETIPPQYEDAFFFDLTDSNSIIVQKHNRYSPALFHKHTFFELLYVYDGNCQQKLEEKDCMLSAGDLCIIPPGIRHSITVNDNSIVINVLILKKTLHHIFHTFLSTPNILSAFFLNNIYDMEKNDYIIFHAGNDYEIRQSFLYMLLESINQDKCYYQVISNTLTIVFSLLIRNHEQTAEIPVLNHLSEMQFKLLNYIQTNNSAITLNDVARHFHYTPEYTSKLIKQSTGMTFSDIVQRVRLKKAIDYLENTNLSIAAICGEIGYESPEYFIRLFKKHMKLSPSAYRKQYLAKMSTEDAPE